MITGLIPIPGSAGVSEYVFTMLFCNKNNPAEGFFFVSEASISEVENGWAMFSVKSQALAVSALLMWRSITFIIPIILAGITTAFYRASPKEEVDRHGDIPNRQTFVALQNETYVMRKEEVDAIVETATVSRRAILERLKGNNQDKKNKKKRTSKAEEEKPYNVEEDEYKSIDIEDEDDSI
jgi:hypothetical protein